MKKKYNGPKILCLDIESTPLEVYTWGVFDQKIFLNQIKEDWSILSWAACWLHDPENIMYDDTRNKKNPRDDKDILKGIHKLMDEADIILGQNSDSFDIKKLNARFLYHGMNPPSSYKKLDTKKILKKHFAFTSASLDYITKTLKSEKGKLKNEGFGLWIKCLNKDKEAFKQLEKYNKQDVAATVVLYTDYLRPWDNSINFDVYHDDFHNVCSCGSKDFKRNGFKYTNNGKYQRFKCSDCGSETRSKKNMLIKEKRDTLRS